MPKKKSTQNRNITEFAKRVKSVLWRQDTGKKERIKYETWQVRVEELESKDGAGYTHSQAIVQASKDYPCLARLFREYDLKEFDPNPESHPAIRQFSEAGVDSGGVVCEGKKQSYRDSLRWAIDAAGAFLRTGEQPVVCPCDAAWYLYEQAKSEPRDFLGKVGQAEMKSSGETEAQKGARASARRSITDLDNMLATLEVDDEGRDESL